jgi:hypothetical protein
MKESYYAGVYWRGRKESARECARRAETFFDLLSRCDPMYARWFEQADSLEEALRLPFEPTGETLLRFFSRKTEPRGDEGFSLGAWTGHEEDGRGSMTNFLCGDSSGAYSNLCLLYLPCQAPEAERVLRLPVLKAILRAMVQAWEPDWGVITSDDLRACLSPEGDVGTFVGWLTYYSRQWGEVPALPSPVRVEPVEDQGTLVLLGSEPLSAREPEHVALGHRVQALLDAKNLLRPVVP